MKYEINKIMMEKFIGKKCPCSMDKSKICVCDDFLKKGECKCGMFVKESDVLFEKKSLDGSINVAVIGVGSMGYNHARIYSDLEGVNLVGISDKNKDNLEKAKRFCKNTYEDYNEMIKKEKIDIISVVVPTLFHKKVAIDVMNEGINILLEKPIASTIEEAKEIIECAKKNNVKLTIGHIERFNPAIIELKNKIQKGELGDVYKIDVNRVGPFPARIRDVGVIIDLAVHDIDIMRFLLDSEVKRVYAETEKQIHTKHEDLLSGLMKFDNKTICNLNINWLTPTKIRKLYVTGEKGMFIANYLSQDLYFYENAEVNGTGFDRKMGIKEGAMTRYVIDKKEPLKLEIESFINIVKTDKEPLISGEDGMMALNLAQKLIKSAEERKVIECNK